MDKDTWLILFTALGAVGTIVAPIIAWRLSKERQEERNRQSLASIISKAPALIKPGDWAGKSTLEMGPQNYKGDYAVKCHFEVKEDRILSGEYTYWVDQLSNSPITTSCPATLSLRGGFNDGRFMTLWLESRDPNNTHFGIMILELAANKKRLTGVWVGFGLNAGAFVAGSVQLDRQ